MKLIIKLLLVSVLLQAGQVLAACSANMTVSSEPQLNAAIACFNAGSANKTISLNISFRVATALEVIDPVSPYQLTIEGNRKRIISTSSLGNILEVSNGTLVVNDLTLLNAAASGITANGEAELQIYDSIIINSNKGISVESDDAHVSLFNSLIMDSSTNGVRLMSGGVTITDSTVDNSTRTGVYSSSGNLFISNSTISNGNYGGVYVEGGDAVIKESTISGNRLNGVDLYGGKVLVTNSTVSDNRIGVYADSGFASIGNSTVAYNRDNGLEAGGGNIRVYSSLVALNAQGGPYGDCIQFSGKLEFVGPARSSFDSDGLCRPFNAVNAVSQIEISTSDLLGFGDYGCMSKHRTPTGNACVKVHPLSMSSIAAQKGACRGIGGSPVIPRVNEDQRGQARPANCGSGAAEYVATPSAVTVLYPSGRIQEASPLIKWSEEANSSVHKYRILIRGSQNELLLNKVLPLSALIKTGSIYSYDTGLNLEPGIYRVWVMAISLEGRGPNSPRSRFIVADEQLPGTVSVLAPKGVTSISNPLFEWSEDANGNARAYRIVVRDSENTILLNQAFMLGDLTKVGSVFKYETGLNFASGVYRVWIRGLNYAGNGPNSTKSLFRIP